MDFPKKLIEDRRGNFGILTALLMPVILAAVGSAIDLSNALMAKTAIQSAADAAALGVLNERSDYIQAALNSGADVRLPAAEIDAENIFKANLQSQGVTNVSLNVEIDKVKTKFTSRVRFSADVPTYFMHMFGFPIVTVSGVAFADSESAKPYDFYLLLDNSPSMGIGAGPQEIRKLESRLGCAFTCHQVGGDPKLDTYTAAKQQKISIRIDIVAKALSDMIEYAKKSSYAQQYRMALYTFGKAAKDAKLTNIREMTYKLSDVSDAAANIKLMSIDYFGEKNHWLTDFDKILSDTKDIVLSNNSPREKIVLIISDGMNDSGKPAMKCKNRLVPGSGFNACWQPIDPLYCAAIKASGAQIAVLYTTFFPLNDENYRTYIAPWQPNLGKKLSECASEGLFFEVSTPTGIDDAMKALFSKVVRSTLLTH